MYHFLTSLLHPLPLGFLCAMALLVWAWRRCPQDRRRPLVWLGIVLVLLAASCTPLAAHLALWSLERDYPPDAPLPKHAGAIVVLSSGIIVHDNEGKLYEQDAAGTARCLRAASLYRRLGPCPVIASGGKVVSGKPGPTLAQALADLLVEVGVDRSDIVLEDASRTTYENAVNTVALLNQRKLSDVVLVSDATHLRRAAGCFRAFGVEVAPVACHHRADALSWSPRVLVPDPTAAEQFHAVVHEWLGLAWYWLRGRTA